MMTGPDSPTGPNKLVIILAAAGGVLLLVVVALVFLLIGQSTANPTAGETPTPDPTPTASESPTPSPTASEDAPPPAPAPAPDTSVRFTNFTADLTVECDPTGEQDKPEITFSWTAKNAVEAWYTPSTKDAYEDRYLKFPNASAGTQNDLTDEHLFPCNHEETMDVTITLVGANGQRVSEHVVYRDVNWQG